jgi:hypothetical protein
MFNGRAAPWPNFWGDTTMKPVIAGALCMAAVLVATAASPQLLKAQQPKAGAAAPKAAAPAPAAGPLIMGQAGIITCQQWVNARTSNPAARAEGNAWVAGFLSALNYAGLESTKNLTGGGGAEGIATALDTDCRTNPNIKVADMLWAGLTQLMRNRGYDVTAMGRSAPLPKLR